MTAIVSGTYGLLVLALPNVACSFVQPAGRPLEGGGVASGGLRDMIPAIARTGGRLGENK